MDASVPPGAAILLDFISVHESRGSYDVIYGNHQTSLPHPITVMTLDQLLSAQIHWGKEWGSSAAGRYQIVQTTLAALKKTLVLSGSEVFSPDLQDRLGFQLLKQRGYTSFMARILTTQDFGKLLAEEWASLPVLAPTKGAHKPVQRGDTYYAGDGINKALVTPVQFEGALTRAHAASA